MRARYAWSASKWARSELVRRGSGASISEPDRPGEPAAGGFGRRAAAGGRACSCRGVEGRPVRVLLASLEFGSRPG